MSVFENLRFNFLKAKCSFLVQAKVRFFLIRFVSDMVIFKQSLINRQYKLANFMNFWISVIFRDVSQFQIACTFFGSILILFKPTIQLRNSISLVWKVYLGLLILTPAFSNALKIRFTYLIYSFSFIKQIRISSKYAITKMSRYSRNISLISA